LVLLKKKLLN